MIFVIEKLKRAMLKLKLKYNDMKKVLKATKISYARTLKNHMLPGL